MLVVRVVLAAIAECRGVVREHHMAGPWHIGRRRQGYVHDRKAAFWHWMAEMRMGVKMRVSVHGPVGTHKDSSGAVRYDWGLYMQQHTGNRQSEYVRYHSPNQTRLCYLLHRMQR